MVLSGTMKASSKKGDIQVRSSWGTLGPVSEVDGVFPSRDLSSVSGGQPKGKYQYSIMPCGSLRQP